MMRQRELVQITGWVSPRLGLKERMKRIKDVDHRMTESRIVEEAVMAYLPTLEFRTMHPATSPLGMLPEPPASAAPVARRPRRAN